MKKLERLFFVSIAVLGLAACSSEMDVAGDSIGDVKHVSMNVADFEWADGEQTRTTAMNNGGNISFRWNKYDRVGIFPNVGDQVEFPVGEGAGTGTAVFDGGGWALKSKSTYVAYYPWSHINRTGEAIPMTYEGQTQVGNNNTDNLTVRDYIVSNLSTPESGEVTFQFRHMGALVRFILTVPEDGIFTSFTLGCEENVFPVEQTLNVRTNPVTVTNKKMSKTIKMSLGDISVNAGGQMIVYMLLPAVDLSSKILSMNLSTSSTTYMTNFIGKTYKSGKAYSHSITLMKDDASPVVHAYVDLGLPSRTLWATCNIGAENPEDSGDYFAWGETTGYNSGKTAFNWNTYTLCNGSSSTMTKYCTDSYRGTVDNKQELDPEDDAAYVNWGSEWRMPTYAQFVELLNNTLQKVVQVNGVNGYKFSKKDDSSIYIFLPAAGTCVRLNTAEGIGYWSRSLSSVDSYGFSLNGSTGYYNVYCIGYERYNGKSVRPVRRE